MNDPVRLPPTTLAYDSPAFRDAHGPAQLSWQMLKERFSAEELDAMGYTLVRETRRKSAGSAHADPATEMLPNLHRMLEGALFERDLEGVRALLTAGARTDLDCMNFGCDPTGEEPPDVADISAMAYAALLDSESGTLEFLPMLAEVGDLRQVDTHGRTLIAYAAHPAVIGFLLDAGVRIDAVDEDDVPVTEFLGPDNARAIEAMALERALPAGRMQESSPRL